MNRVATILALPSLVPKWFFLAAIILPVAVAVFLLATGTSFEPLLLGRLSEQPEASPVQRFAMIFCAGCFAVSCLVLFISLPIYLMSDNDARLARAGGLVKTCLKFIVVSGGGVLATLSFA